MHPSLPIHIYYVYTTFIVGLISVPYLRIGSVLENEHNPREIFLPIGYIVVSDRASTVVERTSHS
jgi:hypothetical protein